MDRVGIVRSAYEAFGRGDLDGALASMSADVVWHQAQGLPHGGVYHGLEAVRSAVFAPLSRDWWSAFDATAEELIDGGDHVVALGRYTGQARHTGRHLDVPFAHVWTFAGDSVVRFVQFVDTAGWNAALAPSPDG
jgi:ketosteroid isomerase-like protein